MMNVKETLKRLHKKFPMMGLDELFDVLDCYIDDPVTRNWLDYGKPKIWYTDNTAPLKTNGIEFNKNNITCSNDGVANSITGNIDIQLTANH